LASRRASASWWPSTRNLAGALRRSNTPPARRRCPPRAAGRPARRAARRPVP